MTNVIPFASAITIDEAREHLECEKCGATAEAKCDCGVGYKYVPAMKIAEKAVMENPQKSNRAIADEIGVSDQTIGRARRKTTATFVAVGALRIGKDGKRRRMPGDKKCGMQIAIPNGYASLSEAVSAIVNVERTNGSFNNAATKKYGFSIRSYHQMRDVILLDERSDLSSKDAATVKKALSLLNEKRQPIAPYRMVTPIAQKLWGSRGRRFDSDKHRLDDFTKAISFVGITCLSAAEVPIPFLGKEQRDLALTTIREAKASLDILLNRISKEGR